MGEFPLSGGDTRVCRAQLEEPFERKKLLIWGSQLAQEQSPWEGETEWHPQCGRGAGFW